jgi:hypothetical protein
LIGLLDVERNTVDDPTTGEMTDTSTVARLLAGAGLVVGDNEFERFVRVYPLLRAQADALHAPEFAGEDLALGYDPSIGFN